MSCVQTISAYETLLFVVATRVLPFSRYRVTETLDAQALLTAGALLYLFTCALAVNRGFSGACAVLVSNPYVVIPIVCVVYGALGVAYYMVINVCRRKNGS